MKTLGPFVMSCLPFWSPYPFATHLVRRYRLQLKCEYYDIKQNVSEDRFIIDFCKIQHRCVGKRNSNNVDKKGKPLITEGLQRWTSWSSLRHNTRNYTNIIHTPVGNAHSSRHHQNRHYKSRSSYNASSGSSRFYSSLSLGEPLSMACGGSAVGS